MATATAAHPTDSEPVVEPSAAPEEPKGGDAVGEEAQPEAGGNTPANDDAAEGKSLMTAIRASVDSNHV